MVLNQRAFKKNVLVQSSPPIPPISGPAKKQRYSSIRKLAVLGGGALKLPFDQFLKRSRLRTDKIGGNPTAMRPRTVIFFKSGHVAAWLHGRMAGHVAVFWSNFGHFSMILERPKV